MVRSRRIRRVMELVNGEVVILADHGNGEPLPGGWAEQQLRLTYRVFLNRTSPWSEKRCMDAMIWR